jgi:hypothetical protein
VSDAVALGGSKIGEKVNILNKKISFSGLNKLKITEPNKRKFNRCDVLKFILLLGVAIVITCRRPQKT